MSKKSNETAAAPPERVQITNFSHDRLNFPVYATVQQGDRPSRRVTEMTIQLGSAYRAKPGANRVEVSKAAWERAMEGSKVIPALISLGMNGGIEVLHIS
jgi:hypothetical protein